jgi:uracil phosphoribosyltransferase
MDTVLKDALAADYIRPHQIILPPSSPPRLDITQLPEFHLTDPNIERILWPMLIHATHSNARKLVQTPMRDANVNGYDLRKAHEDTTLIVPLMRRGEPMAFGVSRAFRTAAFAHAKSYEEIKKETLVGKDTIILVGSVINSGKSILAFMMPLRKELPAVRVIVIAGVVQAKAIEADAEKEEMTLAELMRSDPNLTIVALRKSDNKLTGKGTTDTGHCLVNTTHLE